VPNPSRASHALIQNLPRQSATAVAAERFAQGLPVRSVVTNNGHSGPIESRYTARLQLEAVWTVVHAPSARLYYDVGVAAAHCCPMPLTPATLHWRALTCNERSVCRWPCCQADGSHYSPLVPAMNSRRARVRPRYQRTAARAQCRTVTAFFAAFSQAQPHSSPLKSLVLGTAKAGPCAGPLSVRRPRTPRAAEEVKMVREPRHNHRPSRSTGDAIKMLHASGHATAYDRPCCCCDRASNRSWPQAREIDPVGRLPPCIASAMT